MRQNQIYAFLDNKEGEKRREISRKCEADCDAIILEAFKNNGIIALAEKIQQHIDAVDELWQGWINENKGNPVFELYGYHDSLSYRLRGLNSTEEGVLHHMMKCDIACKSEKISELNAQAHQEIEQVCAAYRSLVKKVQESKNAKEAEAYLRSLGFDLDEISKSEDETKNESNPEIDTRLLFVKAA